MSDSNGGFDIALGRYDRLKLDMADDVGDVWLHISGHPIRYPEEFPVDAVKAFDGPPTVSVAEQLNAEDASKLAKTLAEYAARRGERIVVLTGSDLDD